MKIGIYRAAPAALLPHDPRTFEVAAAVTQLILSPMPHLLVEHIGSTSVEGCPGKGIVDVQCLYPDHQLEPTKELLRRLGFQPQVSRDPFPESRPMRVGAMELGGTTYRIHVHVVAASSPEVAYVRAFRDRLRSDPELRDRYVQTKQEILAQGITDSLDYAQAKASFVRQTLLEMGFTPEELP